MVRLSEDEEEKERLLQSPHNHRLVSVEPSLWSGTNTNQSQLSGGPTGESSLWVGGSSSSQSQLSVGTAGESNLWVGGSSSGQSQLSVGAAEKTFFAMAANNHNTEKAATSSGAGSGAHSSASSSGSTTGHRADDQEDCDLSGGHRKDSLRMTEDGEKNGEANTEVNNCTGGYTNNTEANSCIIQGAVGLDAPPATVVDLVDSRCDNQTKVPDSLEVVREILEEIEGDYEEGDEEECDECRGQAAGLRSSLAGHSSSLVVDVHLETSQDLPRRCSKHSVDRFARSYSESHKTRPGYGRREVLRNLDKIETIGEERLRHLSEGSRRSKPNSLSTEIKQLRRSFLSTRSSVVTESESDLPESCNTIHGSMVSSNSNVKFEIYEEGASGSEFDYADNASLSESIGEPAQIPPPPHPLVASLRNNVQPVMSNSSSTTSMPICRICQLPSLEPSNHLISPCRCLGSIRYVHNPCLLKWLEVSSRKHSGPPCCELCQFQYLRHKKFVVSHCMFPSCSTRDKILHCIFLVAIALMVTCAAVTILCFKQDRETTPIKVVGQSSELNGSELMSLTCGVLFFLAFFLAMYVEVKAKNTIYQLICKFLYMNHEWSIEEYDRKKDPAKQLESP